MITRWRLRTVPNLMAILDVRMVVDTDAPHVVDAIEEAARRNGIVLQRDVEEDVVVELPVRLVEDDQKIDVSARSVRDRDEPA